MKNAIFACILFIILLTGCHFFPGEDYYTTYIEVAYVANDIDEGELRTTYHELGNTITQDDLLGDIVRYSYSLIGWSTTPDGDVFDSIQPEDHITLYAQWELMDDFAIGDAGPAGGNIFLFYNGKYFEAAPASRERELSFNTARNYANDLSVNGIRRWSVPNMIMLQKMFENLHKDDIGSFKDRHYWSSEGSSENAWLIDFSSTHGQKYLFPKENEFFVRPYREFSP